MDQAVLCSTDYLSKIGSIQNTLNDREKRRHELEAELFASSRSEERLAKLKWVKMHVYHKQLCEREKQAKARNLELLRDVECLASHVRELCFDYSTLHQMKLEYKNHIIKQMGMKKKREREGELEAGKLKTSVGTPWHSLSKHPREVSQPAVLFMGRQTLPDSTGEDGAVMNTPSLHLSEPLPDHPSCTSQMSGLLKHTHLSKAYGSAALSDDIQNSKDVSDVRLLSDLREKPVTDSDCDFTQRGVQDLASPRATLSGKGAFSPPREVSGSLQSRPGPNPASHAMDSIDYKHTGDKGEDAAHENSANAEQRPSDDDKSPCIPSSSVQVSSNLSVNTGSGLTVSLSTSHHDDPAPTYGRSGTQVLNTTCDGERQDSVRNSLSEESPDRLSLEELSHLMDYIEGRLNDKDTGLYFTSTVSELKVRDIISVCRRFAELSGADLSVCGVVVLQQLQSLSWSVSEGCLLTQPLVNKYTATAVQLDQIRSSLPADAVHLWDRWLTHVLKLKRCSLLTIDQIIQLFMPVLVERDATYTDKAKGLLRSLLSRLSEESVSLATDESSSCGLPSLLDDSVDMKSAKPLPVLHSNSAKPGLQSAEEDSEDQSTVESIPIRETEAYQLLKRSVAQEKGWDTVEQQEEGSDLELSDLQEGKTFEPTGPSGLHHPSSEARMKAKTSHTAQCKGFWGESDDTNSEIEMVLRPQSHNSNNDDFDDFYD
ncbi:centrosomal protein kizuna [Chanos chanos]|uniref:Centrosomal protein kizuna n=1 Tax=Chanos chanos TaxID=29144 RepID=A0A6J2UQA9_CHACN|nr:centrosomal protein kizuna [Chanos chanos]